MSKIYKTADELIGNTPLLELSNIKKSESLGATLLAKLEYFNPAGSVKDRIAKAMIDDAEKSGKLKKGSEYRHWPCCCCRCPWLQNNHCNARNYVCGTTYSYEGIWR